MKIIYLKSSIDDIEWMKFYYSNIFLAGKKEAIKHLKRAELMIINFPEIGRLYDEKLWVRELVISKTSFSFLYRINGDNIEILRLWDQRWSKKYFSE